MEDTIVVKIGGSTLGSHYPALADLVELVRRKMRPMVVHGGGPMISDWLKRLGVPTRFENGLRVTDEASLDVAVGVLAGVVNKHLVCSLQALGVNAVGVAGVDGALLRCRIADESLGLVGEVEDVDPGMLKLLLAEDRVPVVAPIGMLYEGSRPVQQLLNVNADTAAGAIAAALGAKWLVFMTDGGGVKEDGAVIQELGEERARRLIEAGVIDGGMIPKIEAGLRAAASGTRVVIADGRQEHALLGLIDGGAAGTHVGANT